ncbi:MAG: S66 peptidase family protein [Halorhabdus sp.]
MPELVTPPPLKEGDNVAIVAPASGLAEQYPRVYERGLERIRSTFGLEPVAYPTALKSDDYLRANPQARARDIEDAFADPEISGVIATIGGNDQIRILKHLDTDVLAENPTRFYGISDNTNLAVALWNVGIVSFYGGHLLTEFAAPGPLSEYLERWLRTALFEESIGEIQPAPLFSDQDLEWADSTNLEDRPEVESNPGWIWRGSDRAVTGRTWGGCLEVLDTQLAADRFVPSVSTLEGSILLLETSEELPSPAYVRRALLGMGERGLLEAADGVLVGRIKARSHLIERGSEERTEYRRGLRDAITDVVTTYNDAIPIVCNVDFGHTSPIVPVPIGGIATVDPDAERIAFE